jgi:hypothetical protein
MRIAIRRMPLSIAVLALALTGGLVFTSAPALAAETCPNKAIRLEQGVSEYLPDCRAYEMVSPPYKEGHSLLEFGGGFSSDGEKVIVESLGDLAEAPGASQLIEGSMYLDTRTSAGWQLSSLNSPQSEFVGQIPVAAESNSGETLWLQHTPQQSALTQDLYIRSATGAFSLVGPVSLPPVGEEEPSNEIAAGVDRSDSPVAATSDYQHVVLSGQKHVDYWSFDKTEGEGSLYEYSGTNNSHPILVGVTGEEKGSEDLIGLCGTELGGGGSTYNALSADGETIFFTIFPGCTGPAFAEVYARKHGSLVSPGPASTVDVSASECTLGPACGEESGKNFEGASENSGKVFFTSTQKLTNEAVNGTASGNAAKEHGCSTIAAGAGGCNLYEYRFTEPEGADPKGELRLVDGVVGIAEDGAHLYYVSGNAVPGVGVNALEQRPIAGQPNLYADDTVTGETKFIATLDKEKDEAVWEKEFERRPVEVAGDEGQFLLFASSTPGLTSDDTSPLEQLFEYDAESGELVRVTQGEDGYNDNGNDVSKGLNTAFLEKAARSLGGNGDDFKSTVNQLTVSEDGETVFFETAGELSPRAVSAEAGCTSVYEFRTEGALSEGVVHLVSDGRDTQLYKGVTCGATFQGMDATGANVLFKTADPLVSSDTDGFQVDLYDAREGGGFPPLVSPAVCEGEACRGPLNAAPVFGVPSSVTLTGLGNLASPSATAIEPKAATKKTVKCSKAKRLSHGRCIKVKDKRKAKRASRDRRAKS